MNKTLEDYEASISILTANIALFYSGNRDVYRVVATELRKLLCDKGNSLLLRVFKDIRLHRLHSSALLQRSPTLKDGLVHFMPGRLTVTPDGTKKFELLFDPSWEKIEIPVWIEQPFFSKEITIRELIKSIADKEGAHSDPKYNDTLISSKSVQYVDEESHILAIVAIGEYILKFVEKEPLDLKSELSQ